MKNIYGSPAEGGDFFERPKDTARLGRELENKGNVLLTAPRRVGKTSLALRQCELQRSRGWVAVFLNVEGCPDELAFAERLVDALRREGLHPEALARVGSAFQKLRAALRGAKVGAVGVDVELGSAESPEYGTLGRALESVFEKVEQGNTTVLLVIDELPDHLLALASEDHGTQRLARFLHWLRSLRQTYRERVRWVFLGSIGLDTFVDVRLLSKTIIDLTRMSLDAPEPQEADRFLEQLGADNGLPLPRAARNRVLERIGWPLLHHLQLVFHALKDIDARTVDPAAIDAAIEHLLLPHSLTLFDTWRQRLEEQLDQGDAAVAKQILDSLCRSAAGRTTDQVLGALMGSRPTADPGAVLDQVGRMMALLERDGYLLRSQNRLAFRSFLLREYWRRRRSL